MYFPAARDKMANVIDIFSIKGTFDSCINKKYAFIVLFVIYVLIIMTFDRQTY